MKNQVMDITIGIMILSMALSSTGQDTRIEMSTGAIKDPFQKGPAGVYQTNATELADGGRAVFEFTITNAGKYMIEALVKAENAGENAFYVNMDGEPTGAMVWLVIGTSGSEIRYVSRIGAISPQEKFVLESGTHRLIVVGKSPDTYLQGLLIKRLVGEPPPAPTNLRVISAVDS